jgi:hypothetical protein
MLSPSAPSTLHLSTGVPVFASIATACAGGVVPRCRLSLLSLRRQDPGSGWRRYTSLPPWGTSTARSDSGCLEEARHAYPVSMNQRRMPPYPILHA